jgi:hypothetical protein
MMDDKKQGTHSTEQEQNRNPRNEEPNRSGQNMDEERRRREQQQGGNRDMEKDTNQERERQKKIA